nr:methyltransferase domain-containing protein [Candidatus Sigynarchaeota archaeon]
MPQDFFTRFAVIMAFLGLGVFILLIFITLMLFPFPWNIFDITGNYVARFFAAGLSIGALSWMPIVVVYIRELVANWKACKRTSGLIGFIFQFAGRAIAIVVCMFPTQPWHKVHDYIAAAWLGGEIIGLIFIAIEMLRGKKDFVFILVGCVFILVGATFWVPYLLEIWNGIAIPEISSMILATYLGAILVEDTIKRQANLDAARTYAKNAGKPLLNLSCGNTSFGDTNADIVPRPVPNFVLNEPNARLPFQDKQFGACYCAHTLEHTDDPEQLKIELERVSERVFIVLPPVWAISCYVPSHKWVYCGKWFKNPFYNPNYNPKQIFSGNPLVH